MQDRAHFDIHNGFYRGRFIGSEINKTPVHPANALPGRGAGGFDGADRVCCGV